MSQATNWPGSSHGMERGGALECRHSALLVSDSDGFIDFGNENFSIADLSCTSALHDGINRSVDQVVRQNHFEFNLGHKVNRIFTATIDLGVALLPPMPAHVGYSHAINPKFRQSFLDRLKSGGLNDRFKFGHCGLSSNIRISNPKIVNRNTRRVWRTQTRGSSNPSIASERSLRVFPGSNYNGSGARLLEWALFPS